jgi:hypothetical protein
MSARHSKYPRVTGSSTSGPTGEVDLFLLSMGREDIDPLREVAQTLAPEAQPRELPQTGPRIIEPGRRFLFDRNQHKVLWFLSLRTRDQSGSLKTSDGSAQPRRCLHPRDSETTVR